MPSAKSKPWDQRSRRELWGLLVAGLVISAAILAVDLLKREKIPLWGHALLWAYLLGWNGRVIYAVSREFQRRRSRGPDCA